VAADNGGPKEAEDVSNELAPLDPEAILGGLKDFQRDTVEYVFRRLYLDEHPTRRFLVADEVGLGKTLVARGLIARAIDHLKDEVDRVDIVYICSNADIARQNINRLNVTGRRDFTLASRITLLPTELHNFRENKLNFISFTPQTSFDLRSNTGRAEERVLLYWLLENAWGFRSRTAPRNVLRVDKGKDRFREMIHTFDPENSIDRSLAERFVKELLRRTDEDKVAERPDLRSRFEALCDRFRRSDSRVSWHDKRERRQVVGELRTILAESCLAALEPDLIILDEFQRFKHLLDDEDPVSRLAHGLFDYADEQSKARVVLLSATPYKMYTLAHESAEDDHYADFLRTLRFLETDLPSAGRVENTLREYRRELFRLENGKDTQHLRELKQGLERDLRRVMVRTERLAASENRDGMLKEVPSSKVELEARDLTAYVSLQRVARALGQGDVLEYWKSAPYLLNFMDSYKLKRAFQDTVEVSGSADRDLAGLLSPGDDLLLPWDDVSRYAEIDPGNARLRGLLADTVGAGAWRLLWVPPSMPYYEPEGAFADPALRKFTKRLIFSSWVVVPKVVATMLSYEAERCMISSFEDEPENTREARRQRRPLLRFAQSEGRLTGMSALGLLYPSTTLARECDPLAAARELSGSNGAPTLDDVLQWARARIEHLLEAVGVEVRSGESGGGDEAWYWAAPILLDLRFDREESLSWLRDPDLAAIWSGEEREASRHEEDNTYWSEHVDEARQLTDGQTRLGRPPADLPEVLALQALAGWGTVALRALWRVTDGEGGSEARGAAARVAWSLRSLFNTPEATALVRERGRRTPYWRSVLEYGAAGGLQAVFDEYAHVLREAEGLLDEPPGEVATEVARAMREALGIRTSSLGVDEVTVEASRQEIQLYRHRMRGHFALRFGEERSDDSAEITRAGQVREAFNSPFRPFVLATTSVGQEGLDFHTYCHAVVHWNLPSNPVDLEQREGRVHRYKGHAVRKNLAQKYGLSAAGEPGGDPWERLFAKGKSDRPAGTSDLVPFWIYPLDGGASIERYVPALPLSRDRTRIETLRRSLAAYRMVFGQARQEDLLSYLLSRLSGEEASGVVKDLRINLEPPRRPQAAGA
jgi:hypothetical protein